MTGPDANDTPGVVAHPPLIYLGFLAAGIAIDLIRPVALLPAGTAPAHRYAIGGVLFALGLVIVTLCFLRFRRAGTNVPTNRPSTALVTDGLYRWSRNPIDVALTLAYAGITIAVDSMWVALMLVPVLTIMRYGVIAREERYLEARFGDAYRRYKESVRRWL